jgi:hypothetical protein
MASILAHGAALGLLYFGMMHRPEIDHRMLPRYAVRHLDLHLAEPQIERSAGLAIRYRGPDSAQQSPATGAGQDVPPAMLQQIRELTVGRQTLLDPELPRNLSVALETPIPTVVIWTAQKTRARTIVLPLPHEATAADVRPSLDAPNEELDLADVSIASTDRAARILLLSPSTTSPVAVRRPELVQMVPVTMSDASAQPTPAAAVSLSDLRMRVGTVTLPPGNKTVRASSSGALTPGPQAQTSPEGNSGTASRAGGMGAGRGAADSGSKAASIPDAVKQDGAKAGAAQGTEAGSGAVSEPSSVHITLPKDGKFGVVVVGSSLEEKYPETAQLWSGRLAYTVYLHVGLARSWILQYSLPRADDGAAAGNIAHLEAPWPYNIVRPNIPSDAINADALMVHGFVNQAGRFEALTIAFPAEFAQAQLVLAALEQWQFRPAMQNGQIARVEVLLIVPEELQ